MTDLITHKGSGMGFGRGGWPFPWLSLLLFVALMALAGALIWTWRSQKSGAAAPPAARADDALSALRMRYARGELSRDEFVRANADLGGPPLPTD